MDGSKRNKRGYNLNKKERRISDYSQVAVSTCLGKYLYFVVRKFYTDLSK